MRKHSQLMMRGGGSKPGLSTPGDGVTVLDMSGLRGVVEYEPNEFVFTALAGTPVAEVVAMLAEHGQYLPFDPPFAAAGATLGGAVASGLSGPGRYRYGGGGGFLELGAGPGEGPGFGGSPSAPGSTPVGGGVASAPSGLRRPRGQPPCAGTPNRQDGVDEPLTGSCGWRGQSPTLRAWIALIPTPSTKRSCCVTAPPRCGDDGSRARDRRFRANPRVRPCFDHHRRGVHREPAWTPPLRGLFYTLRAATGGVRGISVGVRPFYKKKSIYTNYHTNTNTCCAITEATPLRHHHLRCRTASALHQHPPFTGGGGANNNI